MTEQEFRNLSVGDTVKLTKTGTQCEIVDITFARGLGITWKFCWFTKRHRASINNMVIEKAQEHPLNWEVVR